MTVQQFIFAMTFSRQTFTDSWARSKKVSYKTNRVLYESEVWFLIACYCRWRMIKMQIKAI